VVDASQELERGRTSFESRAWLDAYTALSEADRLEPLSAADLDLLATSASLLGRWTTTWRAGARSPAHPSAATTSRRLVLRAGWGCTPRTGAS
jgi:hypothetical protein